MDGIMSSLPGGAVRRGGKGSEVGMLVDRFLVGLVLVRMPVKAALRLWLESSKVAPMGVVSLLEASM
jgi:hypothetical protein